MKTAVRNVWLGTVVQVLAACSVFSDPPPDPVGTWALQSIDTHSLPHTYYAPGTGRYIAFADTLVVSADGTCTSRFKQGFYRVVPPVDTFVTQLTGACTWHATDQTLRIDGFIPNFETSYPARKPSADALVIDWKFASNNTIYLWSFSRVP